MVTPASPDPLIREDARLAGVPFRRARHHSVDDEHPVQLLAGDVHAHAGGLRRLTQHFGLVLVMVS